MDKQLAQKLKQIKCVILDVDGVLSNGILYISNQGDELKTFHVHDGVGILLIQKAGYQVAVITNSQNDIIERRMQQLNIQHYYSGQRNKLAAFEHLKQTLKLTNQQCLYIGDDLPDLAIMQQVGVACTVANGRSELKADADYITHANGGDGAVREVCDLLLACSETKELALERFLNDD